MTLSSVAPTYGNYKFSTHAVCRNSAAVIYTSSASNGINKFAILQVSCMDQLTKPKNVTLSPELPVFYPICDYSPGSEIECDVRAFTQSYNTQPTKPVGPSVRSSATLYDCKLK